MNDKEIAMHIVVAAMEHNYIPQHDNKTDAEQCVVDFYQKVYQAVTNAEPQ